LLSAATESCECGFAERGFLLGLEHDVRRDGNVGLRSKILAGLALKSFERTRRFIEIGRLKLDNDTRWPDGSDDRRRNEVGDGVDD
jgi:hypothetical protein